mmetsp:Transcript_42376/g.83538  ORF Transcript_42376/g.83538 Transcript_42376/m.83538 type:complete len:226 (+) Transcript_42376:284-961(+)
MQSRPIKGTCIHKRESKFSTHRGNTSCCPLLSPFLRYPKTANQRKTSFNMAWIIMAMISSSHVSSCSILIEAKRRSITRGLDVPIFFPLLGRWHEAFAICLSPSVRLSHALILVVLSNVDFDSAFERNKKTPPRHNEKKDKKARFCFFVSCKQRHHDPQSEERQGKKAAAQRNTDCLNKKPPLQEFGGAITHTQPARPPLLSHHIRQTQTQRQSSHVQNSTLPLI